MSSVKLYVYDLSQGLARVLSPALLNKQIEGIWHTAVIVYDIEFYYGQGIFTAKPGSTHHGTPAKVVEMGTTEITPSMFSEFLDSIRADYTAEKYNLLDHNCNHFTNEVCQFLVGKEIPSFVLNLSAEIFSTPFGQQFEPMLRSMASRGQQGGQEASDLLKSVIERVPAAAPVANPVQSQIAAQGTMGKPQVVSCNSLSQFEELAKGHPCIVIDFSSEGCPPCRAIYPEFEKLAINYNEPGFRFRLPRGQRSYARERQSNGGSVLLPVKVETNIAPALASKFGVNSTPTFVAVIRGSASVDGIGSLVGANKSALDNLMLKALKAAYPPHPHALLDLKQLPHLSRTLQRYHSASPIANVVRKLSEFLSASGDGPDKVNVEHLKLISDCLHSASSSSNIVEAGALEKAVGALFQCLKVLPIEHHYPVLDLFRLLVLDSQLHNLWLLNNGASNLCKLFIHMESFALEAKLALEDAEKLAKVKPTFLMYLRLASNLIQEPLFEHVLHTDTSLSSAEAGGRSATRQPYRTVLVSIVTLALLSKDAQLFSTSVEGSLWNLACYESMWRDGHDLTAEIDESLSTHADWVIELMVAVLSVIDFEAENSNVTVENALLFEKLLCAQAHFLLFADYNILETCSALDLDVHLAKIEKKISASGQMLQTRQFLLQVLSDCRLILSKSY